MINCELLNRPKPGGAGCDDLLPNNVEELVAGAGCDARRGKDWPAPGMTVLLATGTAGDAAAV